MSKATITVELEDDQFRVAIGESKGKAGRINKVRQFLLKQPDPQVIGEALKKVCERLDPAKTTLLFATGDRRAVVGHLDREKPPGKQEMQSILQPTARKAGMFSEGDELVMNYAESRWEKGWYASFTVAPQDLITTLAKSCSQVGFRKIYICSVDSALAGGFAANTGNETVAILDVRSNRARLVLARHGRALASRKIRLPFFFEEGSVEDSSVLLPLGLEVRRSLEYFGGQELLQPERIILVGSVPTSKKGVGAFQEAMHLPLELGGHPALDKMPRVRDQRLAWAIHAALISPKTQKKISFLLEPHKIPWGHVLRISALQSAGAACVAAGLFLGWQAYNEEGRRRHEDHREAEQCVVDLTREAARLERGLQVPAVVSRRRQILTALDENRMSVSRLCAFLAQTKPEELFFSKLTLDKKGELKLQGVIRSKDRFGAIQRLGELDDHIRSLPHATAGGGGLEDPKDGETEGVPFKYWAQITRKKEGK